MNWSIDITKWATWREKFDDQEIMQSHSTRIFSYQLNDFQSWSVRSITGHVTTVYDVMLRQSGVTESETAKTIQMKANASKVTLYLKKVKQNDKQLSWLK